MLTTSQTIYAGVSATFHNDQASTIAIAVRNTTYLLDFLERRFEPGEVISCAEITGFIVEQLRQYSETQLEKFIGVAIPSSLVERCPTLCARIWAELDIVPIVLREKNKALEEPRRTSWEARGVDEQAESMARKCIRYVVSPALEHLGTVVDRFQLFRSQQYPLVASRLPGNGRGRCRFSYPPSFSAGL